LCVDFEFEAVLNLLLGQLVDDADERPIGG